MGNDYILTIPNEATSEIFKYINWHELYNAQFTFADSFDLKLTDGHIFHAKQILRIIPKRRIVALGTWQGKNVVAKLFLHSGRSKQHLEKDVSGIKTLQDNKIPTPAILFQGMSEDKRIYVLILEQVVEAENLEEIWVNKKNITEILPILKAMMVELATQHVLGVLQKDLHLKNFLITEKIIYTLDGAQVEIFPPLLPKKMSMQNLSLFLAQLGVGFESEQEILFKHYAKARGWVVKPENIIELFFIIKKWNEERWQKHHKKIFRSCTNFGNFQDWHTFGMYNRKYIGPEMIHFLKQPESIFTSQEAIMLKKGRSATVVKVTLDNREFVIKRYNIKNILHYLRRCLRPTRAWNSWQLAQKLNLFGVPTASPVAFIEKRFLWLRGRSYYITEYVNGQQANHFFAEDHIDDKVNLIIKSITHLLRNIAKLEITHGDLKLTNILIINNQPVFIDLDGSLEHASIASLRKAWRKELKRFLDNFRHHPLLLEKFKEAFKQQ